MIPVTVESRLVWRKEPARQYLVPEGTTAGTLLEAIGFPDAPEHVLVVVGKQVCAPERVFASGEKAVLLSVICGG